METAIRTGIPVAAIIRWKLPSGQRRERELPEGITLLIGSDYDADIQINHPHVSGKHCMIWAEEGCVFLRDCYSTAGTIVNGTRITEMQIRPGCHFRIGTCHFTLERADAASTPIQTSNSIVFAPNSPDTQLCSALSETAVDLTPQFQPEQLKLLQSLVQETPKPAPEDGLMQQLQQDLLELRMEHEQVQEQLSQAHSEIKGLKDRQKPQRQQPAEGFASDPFQEEMIELLRSEVDQLQSALAARDNQPQSGAAPQRFGADFDEDLPSRKEVEHVTQRLEQLLNELTDRDQHILVLERLLHAAEEDSQAQQDERNQLNSWVHDIEERFGQREQDWKIRLERLEDANAKLTEERDRVASVLMADDSNAQLDGLQRLLQGHRDEITQLQVDLEATRKSEAELKHSLENRQLASREEEIHLSRERATVARMKHELELSRREFHNEQKTQGPQNELQMIRDKLKDLQEFVPQEPGQPSLAQRLRQLWKRLDG